MIKKIITEFVRDNGKLTPYANDRNHKVLCPVCGCVTFDDYYVCDICGWEFDGVDFDYAKSSANYLKSIKHLQSPKMWRKHFLSTCSDIIIKEYKKLEKLTKNKYRLFDFEYIVYNPNLYRNFYSNSFIDNDTKEFLDEYLDISGRHLKEYIERIANMQNK